MEIQKGIKIIDLALYLTKKRTLVIADTHIGFEEALNKQGMFIPRIYFKELIIRLEKILKNIKPKIIVINGDIKHEFGTISEQEWRNSLKLIDFLARHCEKVVLLKGNHDRVMGPIANKRNVEIGDNLVLDDVLITHGNKLMKELKGIKTIIIGHEHAAVGIRDGARIETFKCFLKGKYKGKNLIVMPAFKGTEGTDLTKEKTLSPFLAKGVKNFDVFVVADRIYKFGKMKNLEFRFY